MLTLTRPVASQPDGGGLNLDGWNTRRTPPPWTLPVWRHHFEKRPHSWTFTSTPPLDIARVTSSLWKTPPLLDIHKHPPLGHCPCDVKGGTKLLKGGTKLLKGGTKLLKGGTKLLKGGTKLLKGGTKLLKGGTKLLKGGTKLLKGGTKLLKGGTKSLGWATGGGRTTPPTPPWLRACWPSNTPIRRMKVNRWMFTKLDSIQMLLEKFKKIY